MVPVVNIFHNVTRAGNRPQMPYNLKVPNNGTHPMPNMSALYDLENYANYQELLKDFGVVIGGGETIRELVSLIEEHIGELS